MPLFTTRSLSSLALPLIATCLVAAAPGRAQTLVGVTGDGDIDDPESLFTIDPADASISFLMALGNGDDGETIAFNPDDGLLYHASGLATPIWERIDASVPVITATGPFTGAGATSEKRAMVHDPVTGRFLVADSNDQLLDTTLAGVGTAIGTAPESLKGLAFSGGKLYAAAQLGAELYELNPANGAVLSTKLMTLGGFAIVGSNGLATHPQTGALWLMFRLDGTNDRNLGVVDPATGVVTSVGELDAKFAGMAYLPEPGGALALGLGAALFAGLARRARYSASARAATSLPSRVQWMSIQ